MSIMKRIAEYDREQEAYITLLEDKVERLENQVNELTTSMMRGIQVRERQTLDLIMAGCLTAPKRTEETKEEQGQ
jgi:hypothetical protein